VSIAAARRESRSPDRGGYALIISSAFCYSLLSIFGKFALSLGPPLPALLATRFLISAIILWLWVLGVRAYRQASSRVPRRRRAALFVWGVAGYAGQSALFFLALKRIPAGLTEVLLYTCPAFLALMLWGTSRRRPQSSRLAAIALAMIGVWLCAGRISGAADAAGAALAILSGLWYAAFLIWMHRLTPGIPGAVSGAYIITGAAFSFSAASLLLGTGFLWPRTAAEWGSMAGLVLSSTVFGFVLFVAGLKRVGPQVASVLSTFEPLGTLLLAAILLGERLAPLQWAGAALIIGAAFVLAATGPAEEDREWARGAAAAALE
jgi:drug/metabolite transporter (DMT)-like permease